MTIKSPSSAEIREARQAAGLSQSAAGALVYVGVRTWQKWELGERAMMPAVWELFLLKIGRTKL